jgi:ABC-type phosphate transport system substrate-binding protein
MVGLLLTAVLLAQPAPPRAAGFVLIVNAENPVDSLSRERVAEMFLKKVVRWEEWDGETLVDPVDQRKGSAVRLLFTREVHQMRPSRINTYWQRLIFSGRGAPPLDLSSDEEVVAFVRQTRGAIGYVSPATRLGTGVKVVRVGAGRAD